MASQRKTLRRLGADQRGQATVEYVLLLAGFALPMVWALWHLMAAFAEYYHMVTFMETLPFP